MSGHCQGAASVSHLLSAGAFPGPCPPGANVLPSTPTHTQGVLSPQLSHGTVTVRGEGAQEVTVLPTPARVLTQRPHKRHQEVPPDTRAITAPGARVVPLGSQPTGPRVSCPTASEGQAVTRASLARLESRSL